MSYPPLRKQLPRQVDPRKLVAQGTVLTGDVPTDAMLRLGAAVIDIDPLAKVSLAFDRADDGKPRVSGDVKLDVRLQCQRCLQPVVHSMDCSLELGIVWDEEQAGKLPASLDPWIVSEESADLYEMVEDELLLMLPIVKYHSEDECAGSSHFSTGEIEDSRENPFSVLAQLKKP